jgi:hypothetical protein
MRVLELAKMGFEQVIIPKATPNLGLSPIDLGGLRVVRRPTLRSALEHCFGPHKLNRAGKPAVEKAQQQQQQQGPGRRRSGRRASGSSD